MKRSHGQTSSPGCTLFFVFVFCLLLLLFFTGRAILGRLPSQTCYRVHTVCFSRVEQSLVDFEFKNMLQGTDCVFHE